MAMSMILRNSMRLQGPSKFYSNLLRTCPVYQNRDKKNFSVTTVRNMDHGKLWLVEKVVSAGIAGLLPAAIAFPSTALDNALTVALVLHIHWGLEAIASDYVRPIIFGPIIPKIAMTLVYVFTAVTFGSLLYYNQNDIGIGKTIRQFWAIKQ